MTDDKKKCYLCQKLSRFYARGDKQYNKTDFGWCREKMSIVNVKDGCDEFVFRPNRRPLKIRTERFLNDILFQLTAIRCIIEEETDDRNDKKM